MKGKRNFRGKLELRLAYIYSGHQNRILQSWHFVANWQREKRKLGSKRRKFLYLSNRQKSSSSPSYGSSSTCARTIRRRKEERKELVGRGKFVCVCGFCRNFRVEYDVRWCDAMRGTKQKAKEKKCLPCVIQSNSFSFAITGEFRTFISSPLSTLSQSSKFSRFEKMTPFTAGSSLF